MGRYSVRQTAADTPLANWLVELAESRGWRSGRQAALYLGVNQAAVNTWLRGELEPDRHSQQRIADAAGVPLAFVADLVWRTKSQKQTLTVGDLQRLRVQEAQELPPTGATTDLAGIEERLDRIERKLNEGLTRSEMAAIIAQFLRQRDAGELPEEYIGDPPEDEAGDDDVLSEAVGA